jgi:hypothetical protein
MDNDIVPTTTEVRDAVERFVPDYKYATKADIRSLTASQLAKLEADLHNLRIMFVANGKNPDVRLNDHTTLADEMNKVLRLIHLLEEYFAEVLSEDSMG